MARTASPVTFLATAVLLALAPLSADAQRPALAGEKARVAEAVKRDLTRLAALQRTHLGRTKSFASDPKDLNFQANSGAEVSIAFASANAWAANASHPTLAPVKCFVIISATDAVDAPTSQPFCTDADPNSAAGRVAAAGNQPDAAQTKAPSTSPTTTAASTPSNPAPTVSKAPARANPPANTPSNAAANRRTASRTNAPASNASSNAAANAANPPSASARDQGQIRVITRDAGEATLVERVETVSPSEFSTALNALAREAIGVMDAPPPQLRRDPYESTPEFEARRAAAMAEYDARIAEWFRTTKRSYVVTLPVRNVRYDADTEQLEFVVDGFRLPAVRDGRSQLTVACFTRPVFWCMPDQGMTYDANDLWKVPRATARQHDVLRAPMTLTARFTVGGRPEGDRALAISLIDLELQARGQMVQRWTGR